MSGMTRPEFIALFAGLLTMPFNAIFPKTLEGKIENVEIISRRLSSSEIRDRWIVTGKPVIGNIILKNNNDNQGSIGDLFKITELRALHNYYEARNLRTGAFHLITYETMYKNYSVIGSANKEGTRA